MATLEGRLKSAPDYKSDEPVGMSFELVNNSNEDLYVLTWYTPLEGLFSDCLSVVRDGDRLPYDGPLPKRGAPTAENYVLVPAGQTVSKEFELSRAYEVSVPGDYDVALDTEVNTFFPSSSAKSLDETLHEAGTQSAKQPLQGGETRFSVLPGGGGKRSTEGQAARESSQAKRAVETPESAGEAGEKAGPIDPEISGGDADEQASMMQAHADGYILCRNALGSLADDDNYEEWFGAHTSERFQKVSDNYAKVKDKMESTTFTYILTGEGCQSNWYAYTYKGETRIWMCGLFWNSPAAGADSKAGTVLHEHSHATARTDDLKYNQANCRQLAIDDPDKAVRNADNYEYYGKG